MAIGIGIIGASGKMGKRLAEVGARDSEIAIVAKVSRANEFSFLSQSEIVIDFSNASLLPEIVQFALASKIPLVIGTTGHAKAHLEAIKDASESLPIFHAPNFSIGVAYLIDSVKRMTSSLPENFAISISERHHIHKKDSPSGTALSIASAIPEKRRPQIFSTREAEIIGEHEVVFSSPEEEIVLRHNAKSRDLFAKGALHAAKFLKDKPPGLYTMEDLV